MRINPKHIITASVLAMMMMATACSKFIEVDEPNNTITTAKMFDSDAKAETAIAGLYNNLIHGVTGAGSVHNAGMQSFAAGLSAIAGGLSAGEFTLGNGATDVTRYAIATNKLTLTNSIVTNGIWNSAYNVIYLANSVIEGLAASNSKKLRDSVRKEIDAEARFIRAFCYFYLYNFYGDVPLALSGDYNKTATLPRASKQAVYKQIVDDLTAAIAVLPPDYSVGRGSRVRANKFAAIALLAKVHLYLGEYEQAAARAGEVISQTTLFNLPAPNDAFLTASKEAIFQLRQTEKDGTLRNATPLGYLFMPQFPYIGFSNYWLSQELVELFEPGDLRYQHWIDSTTNTYEGAPYYKSYYPTKYQIGSGNNVLNAAPREYYTVFRLAEMYLIRAEARANGAPGGTAEAINDLNAVRGRAGLTGLPNNLDAEAVKAAVEKERQTELFCEWGNRWFDLKRTGKASAVLQTMAYKLPWEGDYQLLYPIPQNDTKANPFLIQNDGYFN